MAQEWDLGRRRDRSDVDVQRGATLRCWIVQRRGHESRRECDGRAEPPDRHRTAPDLGRPAGQPHRRCRGQRFLLGLGERFWRVELPVVAKRRRVARSDLPHTHARHGASQPDGRLHRDGHECGWKRHQQCREAHGAGSAHLAGDRDATDGPECGGGWHGHAVGGGQWRGDVKLCLAEKRFSRARCHGGHLDDPECTSRRLGHVHGRGEQCRGLGDQCARDRGRLDLTDSAGRGDASRGGRRAAWRARFVQRGCQRDGSAGVCVAPRGGADSGCDRGRALDRVGTGK